MADPYDDRDRRHRSPRYHDRERRDNHDRDRDRDRHRDSRDDRYRRDDRRDDRRPRDKEYRDRDDRGDRRRHDEDRGARRADSFRDSREDRGRREPRERATSVERRSPTPPGTVPLSQRRRKASGWDVTAPGYEQYSAMQAKQTGLFNLPGANRSHGPQIIGFSGAHPPVATAFQTNTNLARQSRRLYLGSITAMADEDNIALFFNSQMRERGLSTGPGQPVLAVQVNREKNYAFVEFRSAEDATAGMQLDGTVFLDAPLRVRRPHDYAGPEAMSGFATLLPSTMPDSVNKIFIGNLPLHLTEDQIIELLKSFGDLKAFNLVREHVTNQSKGFAFVEYIDPAVTDIATEGLNGMDLGDKKLIVQRASIGAKGPGFPNLPPEAMPEIPAPIVAVDLNRDQGSRILLMLNMVIPEDLIDDAEYAEILDDVRDECSSFGPVEDVRVPRPARRDKSKWGSTEPGALSAADAAKADEAAGVGRVYVKFVDGDSAAAALRSLAGRSFAGRAIVATLISEDANVTPPLSIIFN